MPCKEIRQIAAKTAYPNYRYPNYRYTYTTTTAAALVIWTRHRVRQVRQLGGQHDDSEIGSQMGTTKRQSWRALLLKQRPLLWHIWIWLLSALPSELYGKSTDTDRGERGERQKP